MMSRTIPMLFLPLILTASCVHGGQNRSIAPTGDPLEKVSAAELRDKGLRYAERGDLLRAQQYLSAAESKGYSARVIIPELIRVCVSASRLRAALAYAEPYLLENHDDAGMHYVVGAMYAALGDTQKARVSFLAALRPPHQQYAAAFSLAKMEQVIGNSMQSRKYLRFYLKNAPNGMYAGQAMQLLSDQKRDTRRVSL